MSLLYKLNNIWQNCNKPFLVSDGNELFFEEINNAGNTDLIEKEIKDGDVVAIVGDFETVTITTFLKLCDLKIIIVPLTHETKSQHNYFFETAKVNVVIDGSRIERINDKKENHPILEKIRNNNSSGIIFFSTGTTGKPKAIVHDLKLFLKRFETPRPTLKTLSFLLFDHIGGINTLFHTLFNQGTIISTRSRKVEDILALCDKYKVEALPTTPTFLRMLLLSGLLNNFPKSIKLITYGTERMDQFTLNEISKTLSEVDFRQTYGMSELGILRVKSKARDSLFMSVGGEGIETKVNQDNVLFIRSENRMIGYLNSPDPFDSEGWYETKDIVEKDKDNFIKIIGRSSEIINVGGLKFMASEVENIALQFLGVDMVKVYSKTNPITGEHVEIKIQVKNNVEINKDDFLKYLKTKLQPHMVPKRVLFEEVSINHRFKKT